MHCNQFLETTKQKTTEFKKLLLKGIYEFLWLETFPEMSTFIDSKNAVPKHLDGSKIICPRKLVDNSKCASVNKKLPRSKACMKCLNWCFHKSVSV